MTTYVAAATILFFLATGPGISGNVWAHSGGLDKNGCHHNKGTDYHCHQAQEPASAPTEYHVSPIISARVRKDETLLLLEYLKTTQTQTPAKKSKSERNYDQFMKAFDRNRFKDPPTASTTGEIKRDEHGRIERSAAAKNEFKRRHPCPNNGNTSGSCPGYVIDHIKALKHGGPDSPDNMQWQTIAEGKAKDKWE